VTVSLLAKPQQNGEDVIAKNINQFDLICNVLEEKKMNKEPIKIYEHWQCGNCQRAFEAFNGARDCCIELKPVMSTEKQLINPVLLEALGAIFSKPKCFSCDLEMDNKTRFFRNHNGFFLCSHCYKSMVMQCAN